MTEMVLPGLGMGMTDGTITAWHKAPGDWIGSDEPLCDVEAAKSTVEVFAPREGYLLRIVVPAGTNVPVNTVIAIIGDEAGMAVEEPAVAGEADAPPPPGPVSSPPATPAVPAPVLAAPAPTAPLDRAPVRPGRGPQVEPRARRAARERGLDLSLMSGSGPGGRIVEEDVLRAAQTGGAPAFAPAAGAGAGGAIHQLRMRCDAAPLASLLDGITESHGTGIPVLAVLVRASALALAEAGLENRLICLRSPDDGLQALPDPAALTARAIGDAIAAGAAAPASAPAMIIEPLPDEWLDEAFRIDPAGPPSLSAGPFPPGGDGAWHFTLTFAGGTIDVAAAKRFLGGLRQLLGRPLAILV